MHNRQPIIRSATAAVTDYGLTMDIRPATRQDAEQLIAAEAHAAAREHLRERWRSQDRGDALFLLADQNGAIVGHTILLRQSKYPVVQAANASAIAGGARAR
jgi:hypothetical protein